MIMRTKIAAAALAIATIASINSAPAQAAAFGGLAAAGQATSDTGSRVDLQTVGFKRHFRGHFRHHYRPHYYSYDCYKITFWKHGRKYWKRICD